MLNYGIEPILEYMSENNICQSSKIIDIGAGVGGPSRVYAHMFKSKLNSIEFIEGFYKVSTILDRLQILSSHIDRYLGDITQFDWSENQHLFEIHDMLVSSLCMLHIIDKQVLFQNCSKFLKRGGHFVIQDFYKIHEFSTVEQQLLEHEVSVPGGVCNTKEEYIQILENNGLRVERFESCTEEWSDFVWNRYETFLKYKDYRVELDGVEYCEDIGHFYEQITKLFHVNLPALKQKYPLSAQKCTNYEFPHAQNLGGALICGYKI
eukprot:TRINITY_DN5847_c0_g1_i1.p1 TRINITY_DN5847_c0_g1~~TRINITY_DN5847_c0_g1_i1.p1  ORF type:complete len:264 (+),score=46.62 TRINITY_DN5847_c0_g1_i1:738-1529(+)